MKFLTTIDVEEDRWARFTRGPHTAANVRWLPRLQALFDEFGAKPTYLVTYRVVIDDEAAGILRSLLSRRRCEIGAHCHSWNTPPYEEPCDNEHSMLSHLPADLQYRKMTTLHEAIQHRLGVTPVSFRSGRWGYNTDVAGNLQRLGYRVDTSVTPYVDWTSYGGPDFSDASPMPYRVHGNGHGPERADLIEIPTTIGFLQRNFEWANAVHRIIRHPHFRPFRLVGISHRLRLVNHTWLSPELSTAEEMIMLTRRMRTNGYPLVNMMFHSSVLSPGLTPFARTEEDVRNVWSRLRTYLAFAKEEGLVPATLSEASEDF